MPRFGQIPCPKTFVAREIWQPVPARKSVDMDMKFRIEWIKKCGYKKINYSEWCTPYVYLNCFVLGMVIVSVVRMIGSRNIMEFEVTNPVHFRNFLDYFSQAI